MPPELVQPWRAFLDDIDAHLTEDVTLHCLGGFVVTAIYGMPRTTADVDVLWVAGADALNRLLSVAGKTSPLHEKHGLYVDIVTVAECPVDYADRLTEIAPGTWRNLRAFALDPYDLALAKLQRNLQRDRDDVMHLARAVALDVDVLRNRYEAELRPYIGRPEREDLTLSLWLEMIRESRGV
jgi:hypothetical protein